jgi:hypothetical protein
MVAGSGWLNDSQGAEPAGGWHPTDEGGRQQWLVELNDNCRAGYAPRDIARDLPDAFGKRRSDIAHSAGIGQCLVAVVQLKGRHQSPRAGDLDLQRASVPLGMFFEDVKITREHGARPTFVGAFMRREPPAGRLDVDVQPDQMRRTATDHVGPDTGRGQLDQMRKGSELADHDPRCLVGVEAGQ